MKKITQIVFLFVVLTTHGIKAQSSPEPQNKLYKIPKNFIFGVATSAYQVEGAWNEDGKGESVWDDIGHNKKFLILDKSNGDVACDSYHQYKTDVKMVEDLGCQYYRFSISWPRILPYGTLQNISDAGLNYYKNLIKELKSKGIEPMVTLYHWDMPMIMDNLGGFYAKENNDFFVDYANLIFKFLGDDVKYWITFNEPRSFCQDNVAGLGMYDKNIPVGFAEYRCVKNVLLTHSAVYHMYQKRYKLHQKGKLSMALNFDWFWPSTDSAKDKEAAQRSILFQFGIYMDPLTFGNYPREVIDRIGKLSKAEGLPKSRLPPLTLAERLAIRGTMDFLGLNHYTSWMASWKDDQPNVRPNYFTDINIDQTKGLTWEKSNLAWLTVNAEGFRATLNWIKNRYHNPKIIVTECGFSDAGGLNDTGRINYYKNYLREGMKAIYLDKVNFAGFTAWSLMDNFEWTNGYTAKLGLYSVDFNSTTRERTPKQSAHYFKKIIQERYISD